MVYSPSTMPDVRTVEELRVYLEQELKRIAEDQSEMTAVELRPVHVVPLRPREGMIVFADGADWNPGAGKGSYEYRGGAWNKL